MLLDFESLLFSDPVTDETSKCLGWQSNGDFSFLLGFLWASIAGGKEKKKSRQQWQWRLVVPLLFPPPSSSGCH